MSRSRATRGTLAAVALVALALPACVGRGRAAAPGELRAALLSGAVTVRLPGAGAERALRQGERVPVGSVVRTATGGAARLAGSDGAAVELQGETQITLVAVRRVSLDVGRALGRAADGRALAFDSRGVAVRLGGAARLERLLGALRVGVYEGSARVELLGRGLDVPALREIVVAGGVPLERAPRPLVLAEADPWDRRLLGDVLDFDRDLGQFGRGFNSQFAAQATAPGFYTAFVGVPNASFVGGVLPRTEPADVLVGLVFALGLASREGGLAQVPRLFSDLFALREQGATWGLIAKEKGLGFRALLQAVLDAIRRGTAPAAAPGTGGGGSGGSGGGSTPGPRPSSSPKPSPSPSPTTSPPPPPPPPECSLIDRLLGCTEPAGGTGGGSGAGTGGDDDCSLIGALLDPKC